MFVRAGGEQLQLRDSDSPSPTRLPQSIHGKFVIIHGYIQYTSLKTSKSNSINPRFPSESDMVTVMLVNATVK